MQKDPGRARQAALTAMAELGLSRAALARQSGLALNTVRNFLDAVTWPNDRTLAAIDVALGWPAGTIELIADGGDIPPVNRSAESRSEPAASGDDPPTLGPSRESDRMVVVLGKGWSENLTDLEREAYEAEIRAYALKLAVEWQERTRTRRDEPAQQ